MLGGLGKLAAEGLAHRTEKATEEAGKHLGSGWGLGTKLIPAVWGQALTP